MIKPGVFGYLICVCCIVLIMLIRVLNMIGNLATSSGLLAFEFLLQTACTNIILQSSLSIFSVVGKVKCPSYALPDNDFVYGIESKLDKENAGEGACFVRVCVLLLYYLECPYLTCLTLSLCL